MDENQSPVDGLSILLSQHGYEKPELPPEELATLLKEAGGSTTAKATTTTAELSEINTFSSSAALSLLRSFQSELKRLETSDWSQRIFCSSDAFLLALTDPDTSIQDAKDLVRLPDVIANASLGKSDLQPWYKRIVRTVLLYRRLLASTSSSCSLSTLAALVETLCVNYSFEDTTMRNFFSDCLEFSFAGTEAHLGTVIEEISKSRQEFVIRPVIRMARSSVDLETVLGSVLPQTCQAPFDKLLFSRHVLPPSASPRLTRYLSRCLASPAMLQLLEKSLTLWGDPVIARAYVAGEIMHYTKLSMFLFLHCDRSDLLRCKSRVIEKLVRGLPNHFNSADGRTVMLAKFLSEILTASLKHYEDSQHSLPSELARPTDPLCQELLRELESCEDASEKFWFMPLPTAPTEKDQDGVDGGASVEDSRPPVVPAVESDDDDDDDELEPIETIEPPVNCDIRYIRNFLERLPEMKTHAEITTAFRIIPDIVKQQLAFDHSQIGADLLDQIFLWENEFDDARLDEQRKTSLSAVLTARLDGNLQHFCRMFHRDHVQPYRKSLILDVLFKVARKSSLKDLQSICDASFGLLLLSKDSIDRQDVTVRIPFVLYFARILCLMPEQMLREDHVATYLGALSSLRSPVDSATEQTVRYAISNVMTALGDKKMSAGVQEGIREARDWLVAIESDRC